MIASTTSGRMGEASVATLPCETSLNALQLLHDLRTRVTWKYAAIDVGGGPLWKCVARMATAHRGHDAGGADLADGRRICP